MSLSTRQKQHTRAELQANLELSGLSSAELQQVIGWTLPRLTGALTITGADPADVWRLRDVLENAVRDAGRDPVPFSVLTEEVRASASVWFGI